MNSEPELPDVLKFDSGARGFKRAALLLWIGAGALLAFGIGFLVTTFGGPG